LIVTAIRRNKVLSLIDVLRSVVVFVSAKDRFSRSER
jgi:hypothetical protein